MVTGLWKWYWWFWCAISSEVHTAMLLLPTVGNVKAWPSGGFQQHNVHIKLHQNPCIFQQTHYMI